MVHSVFVYGSLMSDKVLTMLFRHRPVSSLLRSKATLRGFHRFRVVDEVYPAIFPQSEGIVDGVLISGLSDEEMDILDNYEGDDYNRAQVQVELETGEHRETFVYVWKPENRSLLYGAWFYDVHFVPFEDEYCGDSV